MTPGWLRSVANSGYLMNLYCVRMVWIFRNPCMLKRVSSNMNLYCRYCGRQIDPKKVAAYRKKLPQFCNRAHSDPSPKAPGFYTRFSGSGLDLQLRIKPDTAYNPGHAKLAAI